MPGDKIKNARIMRGLSQRELGLLVGKSKQTICEIEGEKRGLSLKLAIKIAKALKVDPNFFLQ